MPHDRLYGLLRLNVLGSSTRNYNIQMIVIYLPYIVFVPLSPRAGEVANARVCRNYQLNNAQAEEGFVIEFNALIKSQPATVL